MLRILGEMIKSKLPNNVLGKIWKLSDVDKDGMLDSDEFALAMHLINVKLDGEENNLYLSKNVTTTFQGMICPRNFQRIWFPPRKEAFEVIEHRHYIERRDMKSVRLSVLNTRIVDNKVSLMSSIAVHSSSIKLLIVLDNSQSNRNYTIVKVMI